MNCKICNGVVATTEEKIIKVGSKKHYYCDKCYKKLLDTAVNIIRKNK